MPDMATQSSSKEGIPGLRRGDVRPIGLIGQLVGWSVGRDLESPVFALVRRANHGRTTDVKSLVRVATVPLESSCRGVRRTVLAGRLPAAHPWLLAVSR